MQDTTKAALDAGFQYSQVEEDHSCPLANTKTDACNSQKGSTTIQDVLNETDNEFQRIKMTRK